MRVAAVAIATTLALGGAAAADPMSDPALTPTLRAARIDALPLRLAGEDAGPNFTLTQPDPYKPYATRPRRTVLVPSEVAASLKARGFVDVSEVRQRGGAFLAEATGPRGERVRLVVDAASGEISGMQVIGFGPPR